MCSDIQPQLHPCIPRLGRSPFGFNFQTFQNCGSVENPPRVENVFKQSKAKQQVGAKCKLILLHLLQILLFMEKIVSHIMREKKSIWKKVSCFKRILKAPLQTGEILPTGKASHCSSNMQPFTSLMSHATSVPRECHNVISKIRYVSYKTGRKLTSRDEVHSIRSSTSRSVRKKVTSCSAT